MNKDSFLRIQLILSDNNATSLDTNLAKMISVVIFNAGRRLTVSEIKNDLLNSYELEFTEEEIRNAASKRHSGITQEHEKKQVSRHGNSFEVQEEHYCLSPQLQDKYKRCLETSFEEEVIRKFIKENPDITMSAEEFKELLHGFLYGVFNSNKDTLLLLLNETVNKDGKVDPFDYDENQRLTINTFLNWDNTQKDQLIYQTVSYCVEYCLLNIKKGFSSFENIFKGKRFYLDTNVILRLAGINNEERRTVISSFIRKCKENGIELFYTNYTYQEIRDTIHKNVVEVKNTLSGHMMVSKKHWRYYSKPSTNLDFIDLYDAWCREPGSDYSDFKAFEKYLMRNIETILKQFKKQEFLGFEAKQGTDYEILVDSLAKYKDMHGARHYDKSVAVDINNYMYVRDLRKKNGLTISDIKEYLISTDANFCNWSKEIITGSIPVVVLPSVWYSLILKFRGRADDDYKAFNLFLNLRFRTIDNKFDNQKDAVLHMVQKLDEPTDIKNLILDDIYERITENQLEEIDPERIVDEAKNSVITKEAKKLSEQYKEDVGNEIQLQTEVRTLYSLAEKRAMKKHHLAHVVSKVLTALKVLCGIVAVVFILLVAADKIDVSKFMNVTVKGYKVEGWIDLLAIMMPIIIWAIINPIKKVIEKNYTFEAIKNREFMKLKKEFGSNGMEKQ